MKPSPLAQFFLIVSLFGVSLWWAANGAGYLYWPYYIFTALVASGGLFCASIGALFKRTMAAFLAGAFVGYLVAYVTVIQATITFR